MTSLVRAPETVVLCLCEAAGGTFALPAAYVRAIHSPDRVRPGDEPGGPPILKVDGGELPAYDLAERLGLPPAPPGPDRRAIGLKSRLGAWALVVDSMSQPFVTERSKLFSVPRVLYAGAAPFDGVLPVEGRFVFVLAPERFHPKALAAPPVPERRAPRRPTRLARGARRGRLVLVTLPTPETEGPPVVVGLSVTQICEIVDDLAVMPIPGIREHVAGLAQWRDSLVSVVDLGAWLGLGRGDAIGARHVVITKVPGTTERVGIPVLPGIRTIQLPVEHEPATGDLGGVDETLLLGAFDVPGSRLLIPDLRQV